MKLVTDFILFIIALGIVEAVLKPAAIHWTKKGLVKWTPVVLDELDRVFPSLLLAKSNQDLDFFVRAKFSELTGEDWSSVNIDYFWQTYDPRVALDKVISREAQA